MINPNLQDEIQVTVIATGFAREEKKDSLAGFQSMQNFLSGPSLTFDLPQQPMQHQTMMPPPQMPAMPQAPIFQMNSPMSQEQIMQMMMQLQQLQSGQAAQAAMAPPVVTAPVQTNVLPSIDSVQETVQAFTAEETSTEVYATPSLAPQTEVHFETPVAQDFSSAVSPLKTQEMNATEPTSTAQTARDLLMAKAKAFRESQTATAEEKAIHPEQLTMMDEERQNQEQMENARKMARDILEVPAFIRKKQGFDLQS